MVVELLVGFFVVVIVVGVDPHLIRLLDSIDFTVIISSRILTPLLG